MTSNIENKKYHMFFKPSLTVRTSNDVASPYSQTRLEKHFFDAIFLTCFLVFGTQMKKQ